MKIGSTRIALAESLGLSDISDPVTILTKLDIKPDFSNIAKRVVPMGAITTNFRNGIEFWSALSTGASSLVVISEIPRPIHVGWQACGCAERLTLFGETAPMSKLHETIIEIEIRRLHRHFVIFAKRHTEPTESILWADHDKSSGSMTANATKTLTVSLARRRNTGIQAHAKVGKVNTQFKRGR